MIQALFRKSKENVPFYLPGGLPVLTVRGQNGPNAPALAGLQSESLPLCVGGAPGASRTPRRRGRGGGGGGGEKAGPGLQGRSRGGRRAGWEAAPYWRRPRCIVINRAGFVVFFATRLDASAVVSEKVSKQASYRRLEQSGQREKGKTRERLQCERHSPVRKTQEAMKEMSA